MDQRKMDQPLTGNERKKDSTGHTLDPELNTNQKWHNLAWGSIFAHLYILIMTKCSAMLINSNIKNTFTVAARWNLSCLNFRHGLPCLFGHQCSGTGRVHAWEWHFYANTQETQKHGYTNIDMQMYGTYSDGTFMLIYISCPCWGLHI